MDISRTLKEVILITPWLISIGIIFFASLFVYLFLLFVSNLIFIGKKVLLGGTIVETRVLNIGTEIEVVQKILKILTTQ